ncbi:type VI secretion system lipoprotein TssJ [Malaciobacter sp. WC5094]
MKFILKTVITVIIAIGLVGCSSKPTHLELVVNSTNDLNPDINNVSSPLMLTFYELESAENFMKYDYWTLMQESGKNLNRDLISQSKHVITPHQKQTYKIVFNDNAKFLGVVGQFRNIKNKWKYVINLEEDTYNFSELEIHKYSIERVE